ncbi:hypothetical protein ACP275_08G113000 [Erythranthe tilingii]
MTFFLFFNGGLVARSCRTTVLTICCISSIVKVMGEAAGLPPFRGRSHFHHQCGWGGRGDPLFFPRSLRRQLGLSLPIVPPGFDWSFSSHLYQPQHQELKFLFPRKALVDEALFGKKYK